MSFHLFARITLILILTAQLVALGTLAYTAWSAGRQRIVDHFIQYAKSYLIGSIFVTLSLLASFVAEFEHIARADRLAFDSFDWALHFASAAANALTTILAFLNNTPAADKASKPEPVQASA